MLELKDINLHFGSQPLLKDLSVKVPSGGRLLIEGESGTGKSTILRLILGLVRPDSGTVCIEGEVLNHRNVWAMRRKMAYVSQDMQLGRGRVEAFIREIFSFKQNQDLSYSREKAVELLEHFGLPESTLEADLENLSGGELQRVAIIITLLLQRKIYLLDEITSALDQNLKSLMVEHFTGLEHATLVVVSHDPLWHEQGFQTIKLSR